MRITGDRQCRECPLEGDTPAATGVASLVSDKRAVVEAAVRRIGHQAAPPRGKGGKAPIRDLHGSATRGGFEGGADATPRQPLVPTRGMLA